MNIETVSSFLETYKPLEIFKKVITFNTEVTDHNLRARVRVGLSSGFAMEGIPLKIDEAGNVVFISHQKSIGYINANTITGIEILNPELVMDVLTNGSFFQVPQDAVPTNLQLKRSFKSQTEEIKKRYGINVHSELVADGLATDAEKYQFERFLKMFPEIFGLLAKDTLGKEALSELKEIGIISSEEQISMNKSNNRITVGINFKNKFSTDFKERLHASFEAHL